MVQTREFDVQKKTLKGKEIDRGALQPSACLQESPQLPRDSCIPESHEAVASVRRDPARAQALSQRYHCTHTHSRTHVNMHRRRPKTFLHLSLLSKPLKQTHIVVHREATIEIQTWKPVWFLWVYSSVVFGPSADARVGSVGAREPLENFSTSTYSLRRPGLVLVSGSSLPRACAHVKESLASPIPGIADAGKNAVMEVAIGSGWVDAGSETERGGDLGGFWCRG